MLSEKAKKCHGVADGGAEMGVNGQKLIFKANGRGWRDYGVEIAWNSFFSVNTIATASSDDVFVNESGGGVKGSPISRRKWG